MTRPQMEVLQRAAVVAVIRAPSAGRWEEIEQSARRFATALRGRADHTSGGLP